ncbi:hypothetical protein AGDE_15267 [Angomonas deanei]|uniref:Uncharacterized protein n=1 Tax=Angomonas deanei TaxID=59799 RepID=A0A7G2CUS6_9TRYP|nr:hypothetical protein AGDE_15267 [Angomonas deanei]CAD2222704.1 hypothetical protein, conserved [Angomonas deanei]|eukprot:EPY19380.1 hypothetical protein AGDE_15267 [Angomonas deanei]
MAEARREKKVKNNAAKESSEEQTQNLSERDRLVNQMTERIVPLPFTSLNDCSFLVEFQTVGDDDSSPHSNVVRPKKVHLLQLNVDTNNEDGVFSTTGGSAGEAKATSSSAEAIGAAYHKSTAKLSAWAKGAFRRLGNDGTDRKEKDKAAQQAAFAQFIQKESASTDKIVPKGAYKTVVSGVDFSEAYNAPGGRKQFHIVLQKDGHSLPSSGEGVPVFLTFTVVAHFDEPKPKLTPRNFHNFAIVVDQMVLNLSEAEKEMPAESEEKGGLFNKRTVTGAPRPVVGYGYGLTSNTFHKTACMAKSVVVPSNDATHHEGTTVSSIDFASLHNKDERHITKEDYERLPTSCCIVSSGCHNANQERVGARFVCVSRFKTNHDGLCKPSLKCQLTFSIFRKLASGEIEEEAATSAAISLADVLNDEQYPQRIREIHFSLGEILYFRLQRYCFVDSQKNKAPLLMPFDYDNSGVEISDKAEAISSWTLPERCNASNSDSNDSGSDTVTNTEATQRREVRTESPAEQRPPTPQREESASPSEAAPEEAAQPDNPFFTGGDDHHTAGKVVIEPMQEGTDAFANPFDNDRENNMFTIESKEDPYATHYEEESTGMARPSFEITGESPFFTTDSPVPPASATPEVEMNYNFGGEKEDHPMFEISPLPEDTNPYKFD